MRVYKCHSCEESVIMDWFLYCPFCGKPVDKEMLSSWKDEELKEVKQLRQELGSHKSHIDKILEIEFSEEGSYIYAKIMEILDE